MDECINEILEKNIGKRIAIFSHGYAITFYLLKYCKLESLTEDRIYKYSFKDKVFFNGELNAPEVFKLTFNDNELEDIENIKINYDEVVK